MRRKRSVEYKITSGTGKLNISFFVCITGLSHVEMRWIRILFARRKMAMAYKMLRRGKKAMNT